MRTLLLGVFFGFLIASLWNNHVSAAQARPQPAQIWVGTWLQVGMPRDSVIAKVAEAGYEVNRTTGIEGDYWIVSKKNENSEYDVIGSMTFNNGKLTWANHTLYDSSELPAAKLARNFYFLVHDLETDHNNVCTLESKNQESADFYSKTGILHCGNRTISVSVSKYKDQQEEGQLTEAVK